MTNHLEEAKLNVQLTEDSLAINRDNYTKDGILHALIAIAEQFEIANTLKRIKIENMEGVAIKQKDLPLWFKCGGGK